MREKLIFSRELESSIVELGVIRRKMNLSGVFSTPALLRCR
jgi:hypothetical protein